MKDAEARYAGNVALVALYGEKPQGVTAFIIDIQGMVAQYFPSFRPYQIEQIHGSVIGLEGAFESSTGRIINKNYLDLRSEVRAMDIEHLIEVLERCPYFPLHIRIGGCSADRDHGFLSRGSHPWDRSFFINGQDVVMIGWPVGERGTLHRLRASFNEAGVLHKYHSDTSLIDDDFYVVLGHLDRSGSDGEAARGAIRKVRTYLSQRSCCFSVSSHDLSIVQYLDRELPINGTVVYRMPIRANDLAALYYR